MKRTLLSRRKIMIRLLVPIQIIQRIQRPACKHFLILLLIAVPSCVNPISRVEGPIRVSSDILFQIKLPEAKTVSLAGTFNNWDTLSHRLLENSPGYWTAVVSLPMGRYEYQFVIDQKKWIPDPTAKMMIEDGFGQNNSLLIVE